MLIHSQIHMTTRLNRYTLAAVVVLGGAAFYFAQAASVFDITYPIPELGGCADRLACKAYCDAPENTAACVKFAQDHGLIIKHEAQQNQRNQPDNANLQKIAEAIKNGGPGGCKTFDECKVYCNDPANSRECFKFAREHSIVSQAGDDFSDKIERLIKAGKKLPGDCKTYQECSQYCSAPENHEECMAFGRKEGLINKDEADKFAKAQALMDSGQAPGGCKTKEECQQYCSDSAHTEECVEFGIKAGFMKKEDAERFRKLNGVGPGGCKGREECQQFCSSLGNQETCLNFAKEHGLLKPEDLQRIKEQMMRSHDDINNGEIDNIDNGYQEYPDQQEQPAEDVTQPEDFEGPGGCLTIEDCKAYCSDPANQEECQNFKTQMMQRHQSPQPQTVPQSQAVPRNKFLGAIVRFLLGFR